MGGLFCILHSAFYLPLRLSHFWHHSLCARKNTPGPFSNLLAPSSFVPATPELRRRAQSEKACMRSTPCYSGPVKTMPLSIRLDKKLRSLLVEGARRTPFNQRELLRRTLRLHLREVIEQEAAPPEARITNIDPWPRGCLAKAYRRVNQAWDRLEADATAAQGRPSWDD